jgi:hypothetical protein
MNYKEERIDGAAYGYTLYRKESKHNITIQIQSDGFTKDNIIVSKSLSISGKKWEPATIKADMGGKNYSLSEVDMARSFALALHRAIDELALLDIKYK